MKAVSLSLSHTHDYNDATQAVGPSEVVRERGVAQTNKCHPRAG